MTLPEKAIEERIKDALRRAQGEGVILGEPGTRLVELLTEGAALALRDIEEMAEDAGGLGSKFEQAVRRFRRREGIG